VRKELITFFTSEDNAWLTRFQDKAIKGKKIQDMMNLNQITMGTEQYDNEVSKVVNSTINDKISAILVIVKKMISMRTNQEQDEEDEEVEKDTNFDFQAGLGQFKIKIGGDHTGGETLILNRDITGMYEALKGVVTTVSVPVQAALQWPLSCHELDKEPFQKYLFKWLKDKNYKEFSRFPPDSIEKGKEWNNEDYNLYLKGIVMVDSSKIHNKGVFLQEGYQLTQDDLILYPGYVHFKSVEDGFDLQVDLYPNSNKGVSKFHTSIESVNRKKANNEEQKKEAEAAKEEAKVDESERFVYIVPGIDDVLRYLNDSRDDKQIFSGLRPTAPFIFEVSRDIRGSSQASRRKSKIGNCGELTLFYGYDYQFTKRTAAAKAQMSFLSASLGGRVGSIGSGSYTRTKKKKPSISVSKNIEGKSKISNQKSATVFIIQESDDETYEHTTVVQKRNNKRARDDIPTDVRQVVKNKYLLKDSAISIRNACKVPRNVPLVDDSEVKHFLSIQLTWFRFDLEDAMDVCNFDSDKGKLKIFTKVKKMQEIINASMQTFVSTLNSHLDESNCINVMATEAVLIRVPLTVAEAPPLVHHSDGNCSNKKFDLISYSFLEKVEVEIRSHMDYLESFWWLSATFGNDLDQNHLNAYEEKYQREPTVISVYAGPTNFLSY